jgi:AcrR family transcriptional regulator
MRAMVQAPATDKGEATRRAILETAALAFADNGYSGASLNDIIRESGVTKGGFYFHFPSKETLALEVLRYKQEQWASRVVAATMHHERAIDQMTAMVAALCDLHEQDPSSRCIGRLCTELGEQNPALAPKLTPQFTRWVELTSSVIARAQQQGEVRTDVDPVVAGEVAVSSFIGSEMISEIVSGMSDLRSRAQRLEQFFRTVLLIPEQ